MRTVHRLEGLDAIFDDDVDGVIVARQTPALVASALNTTPIADGADARFRSPPEQARDRVHHLFQEWGSPAGPAAEWVADDVGALARRFAKVLSLSDVLIRVEWVCDDACRKFHQDSVRARLICTYCGPGTQFGVAHHNGDPDHVDTAPTGGPILLKGKLWPGPSRRSVKHRSPPIEGTEAMRLVVVINEASPEPD